MEPADLLELSAIVNAKFFPSNLEVRNITMLSVGFDAFLRGGEITD
jgi:hypothetical protein